MEQTKQKNIANKFIRNFCIIAHIDHGKSTLADRFLEQTGVVSNSKVVKQILDDMPLERERGITIKAHAIKMPFVLENREYLLNLIDTPGHVDFSYEVSKSLASCEGAILLVDASQGVEAQTLANLYLALEHNLDIIPVINKIDLPSADVQMCITELGELLGEDEVFLISAKDGVGIKQLLEAIVQKVSPPKGDLNNPAKALIFDSFYDTYRGVVVLFRLMDGILKQGDKIKFFSNDKKYEIEEIGTLGLKHQKKKKIKAGDVGYIVANVKSIEDAKVGDTITTVKDPCEDALAGFSDPKPMVYSGIFPISNDDYEGLKDSLAKLKLNDVSLVYEPENSLALGFGFRCGFLGMLHLEIVRERLLREYNIPIITTTPSVPFIVQTANSVIKEIHNPMEMPNPSEIVEIKEPFMRVEIVTPKEYIGNVMKLAISRRGVQKNMQYVDEKRVTIEYEFPLLEIIFDFYDKLKSISRGYASMDYSFLDHRKSKIIKVDILINGEKVDAMSFMAHETKAHSWGKSITDILKDIVPRHLFKIALQAAIGGKIIARSTIGALRKNVTAKCYGGDITRKRKLLEKQKAGKKRMKEVGSVSVPQEAFLAVLKADKS